MELGLDGIISGEPGTLWKRKSDEIRGPKGSL